MQPEVKFTHTPAELRPRSFPGTWDATAGVGQVDYQDGTGAWHRSTAWPPNDAREEVLYLRGRELSPSAGAGSRSFRAQPDRGLVAQSIDHRIARDATGYQPPCPGATGPEATGSALIYTTPPAREPVLVAGNPFAYLRLESGAPRGGFALQLYDLGPDFGCNVPLARDYRFLTEGTVDLAFHAGNLSARDFPTARPEPVRIDMQNLAESIRPGHRLAAVLTFGATKTRLLHRGLPALTVHAGTSGDSQLVLPLVGGGFGGNSPRIKHPPRPFLGAAARGAPTDR